FGLTHTVTAGIVSAKGRFIGAGPYDDFIQTDASINPGNSGGPLFNLKGEVVGINTAIVPYGQGIGFAVPINQVKEILDDLKTTGTVARGWIGIGLQPLDEDLAEQLGVDEGVVISQVYPDNPAAKAGLRAGDVIVELDGEKVDETDEVVRAIGARRPGDVVKLGIIRDGKEKTIKVELGQRPDEEDMATRSFRDWHRDGGSPDHDEGSPLDAYGFRVEKRKDLGHGGDSGLVVTAVLGGSPAAGRLEVGDRIKEVNRHEVRSVDDIERYLGEHDDHAMLVVDRDGAETLVVLSLDDDRE
ncbi:MAG: PDZ domain-containing protein, partial [Deltaproteobacteria bacterium]